MTSKCMSGILKKFSKIPSYQLGSIRISRSSNKSDYNTIASGLTLWYGVVSDYNSMFCLADEASRNHGRIIKHAIDGWTGPETSLQSFLEFLDELGDILLKHLSSSDGFKAHLLLKELKTWSVVQWLAPLKGAIYCILSSGLNSGIEGNEVRVIKAIRTVSTFLKKMDVSRPDLEDQMREEFLEFEIQLSSVIPQRIVSDDYKAAVSEMKLLLSRHLDQFKMDPFVPGHGPGAVSSPEVKCWYEKHTNARTDRRVGYLLSHADLGYESDYLPFVKVDSSTRTSRYICVPKTWKKLRGISAEPIELQFWQQGVLGRIDWMFRHDKWWGNRVNLHDQNRSRKLALQGSIDGSLATVDLSSASDSVTLQLVRDVFGNTKMARWLLGTRSTHTLCGSTLLQINKFAPMGSACCFPTECMIFTLAAEIAVSRTRQRNEKVRTVCVYGDDIILPSYAVQELFKILAVLGFSVNKEKTFSSGEFREACGIEAWNGIDIAPCRFRSWRSGINSRYLDYAEIASLTMLANEMLGRGLHDTRKYLLKTLLDKKVKLGNSREMSVQDTIFATFTGERNTLASFTPTNFNLVKKLSGALQTLVYRRVVWQERLSHPIHDGAMASAYDEMNFINWLIKHQTDCQDWDERWSQGWIDDLSVSTLSRLPIGVLMVPTVKWSLAPSFDFIKI